MQMKTFFLIVFVFLHLLSYCQNGTVSSVQITNHAEKRKIYLYVYKHKLPVDSAIIDKDSMVCLSFQQHSPIYSLGLEKKPSVIYFFKDPGHPVYVNIGIDEKITVHNSRLNMLWSESKTYQDSAVNALIKLRGTIDSTFIEAKNSYEKWAYHRLVMLMEVDTFVAVRFLNFHLNKLERLIFANPLYMDSIHLMMQRFPIGSHPLLTEEMFGKIEGLSSLAKGSSFYHFTLLDVNNDTISTKQFSGKTLLVDFWASWCKPCREKNQELKKYYDRIRSKNIEILGVSLDDNLEPWKSALEKDKLPWVQGKLLSEQKKTVQQKYNAYAIPLALLFSEDGKLLEINPSLESLIK